MRFNAIFMCFTGFKWSNSVEILHLEQVWYIFYMFKSSKCDYFHPKMTKNHIKQQKRFLYSI